MPQVQKNHTLGRPLDHNFRLQIKNNKLHIVTDIKVIMRNVICHEKRNTLATFCSEKCQYYEVRGNQRRLLTKGRTKEPRDILEEIKEIKR